MGIKDLWEILNTTREDVVHTDRGCLDGGPHVWAVDLAGWICEAETVKAMQGTVSNAYLRNLFFRVRTLRRRGVELVFVLDGAVPDMKLDTVYKRINNQGTDRPSNHISGGHKKFSKMTRKRLNCKLKKCSELLNLLNVPWVKAAGEAEAVCAALNQHGLATAVVTNDSDVFLYGALTVYRSFTCDQKKITYAVYRARKIREVLGLNRSHLIGLGLLLGSDFCAGGCKGVGKVQALKLMSDWKNQDAVEKMRSWRKTGFPFDSRLESKIYEKATEGDDAFPDERIIGEFTADRSSPHLEVARDRLDRSRSSSRSTASRHVTECVAFVRGEMDWEARYALDACMPHFTRRLLSPRHHTLAAGIKLERIIKDRVREGVEVFECEWFVDGFENDDDYDDTKGYVVTIEERSLVASKFASKVEDYWRVKREKSKKKKTSKKTEKKAIPEAAKEPAAIKKAVDSDIDQILSGFNDLDLSFSPCATAPKSEKTTKSDHGLSSLAMNKNEKKTKSGRNCVKAAKDVVVILSSSEDEDVSKAAPLQVTTKLETSVNASSLLASSSFDNSCDLFSPTVNSPCLHSASNQLSEKTCTGDGNRYSSKTYASLTGKDNDEEGSDDVAACDSPQSPAFMSLSDRLQRRGVKIGFSLSKLKLEDDA